MTPSAPCASIGLWRLAALALAALVLQPCASAALPPWAKAALDADTPRWQPGSRGVVVLDALHVRFIADKAPAPGGSAGGPVERTVSVLWRGVVRVRGGNERDMEFASLTYDPNSTRVVSASAWIVSPDGRKTAAFSRGDFVDTAAVYSNYVWDYRRVLRFASAGRLEVDGVLVWEFQIERAEAFSEASKTFLQPLPSLRSEFEVIPAPGTRIEFEAGDPRLRHPLAGAEPGSLKWELLYEEPVPAKTPTTFKANPLRVSVRCVDASPGALGCAWDTISRKASEIIEPRIDPGAAEIRRQADLLVGGRTGRWDRVRELCAFVQANIDYLEITLDRDALAGYRPHPAAEVLRNRYGDCKDKASLLISMLRAEGEDAHVLLLSAGDPFAVWEDWPSQSFNHAIVGIRADGSEPGTWPTVDAGDGSRWVLFDPTNPFTPLGVLPSEDEGGFGLIVAPRGGALIRMPVADPASSRLVRRIALTLDAKGGVRAKIAEDCQGLTAAKWYGERHSRSREQYQAYVETRVHRANPLCEGVRWTSQWDPGLARFHIEIEFSTAAFGRALPNGMMLVTPDVLPGQHRFEPWTVAIDGKSVLGPDALDEEDSLEIPAGCAVEELPDGWKKTGRLFAAEIVYRVEGNAIILHKSLTRSAGFFDKDDYEEIRGLYREFQDAAHRSVILRTAAAAAKG